MSGLALDAFRIRPETFRFTLVLGLLAALPSLSIDISAPSLLRVQEQLVARPGIVGLTITLFMLGFALGQFGAGPLSDRYGRRPVLICGLSGYTLAGLGCATASSAELLVGWRLMQGAAAGACAVLAFTMIRDLFEGDQARVKRSYVTVVFGLAPMLAPTLGAWIMAAAGWRLIYVALAVAGVVLLVTVMFGVAESRSSNPPPLRGASIRAAYRHVLSNRRFAGLAAVNAFSFGSMFAYIAGSPLVFMGRLNLSAPEYGLVFACTAGFLTLGAWASGQCAKAGIDSRALLWAGLCLTAASAILLAILLACRCHILGLLIPLLLANLFARGLVAPTAQHMALEPMRAHAGTAAAAVGVLQILMGAASSAVVALLFPIIGSFAMGSVMAVLGVSSLVLWFWVATAPKSLAAAEPGV